MAPICLLKSFTAYRGSPNRPTPWRFRRRPSGGAWFLRNRRVSCRRAAARCLAALASASIARISLMPPSTLNVTGPGSPPLSIAAMPGARTLAIVAAPEVSLKRSISRSGATGSACVSASASPKRLPIDHQRQIDREFEHRARADWAGMFEPAAQLLENGPCPRDVGGVTADKSDELALPRRSGRAADRTLDEGGAPAANRFGQRHFGCRQYRTHVDEQLSGGIAAEQSRRSLVDRAECCSVGQA